MTDLVVVRSAAFESAKLAGILRAFGTTYERKQISLYTACEQETLWVDILGASCPPLSCVRPTREITVAREDLAEHDRVDRIADVFFRERANKSRKSLIRWEISESGKEYNRKKENDVELSVGWSVYPGEDIGRWYSGCRIGWASPGMADKVYRRDLFRRVVEAWGLKDQLPVELNGNVLTVMPTQHWKLWFPEAEFGGKNPRGFEAGGYKNFEAALHATRSALRALSKRIDAVSLSCVMPPELYVAQREALNKIPGAWHVEVDGHLTPEAETVLQGGPIADSLPDRIPAFFWRENQDWIMFYGQLVITPKGLCLELISNCGDVKKLLKRARIVDGVEFHEVKEPAAQ